MSLVELVVAMVLAGGVALALGHVVNQLTRNVTALEQRAQRQTEGALALLRLRGELRHATGVSALTDRRIAFAHPDVTGDGMADLVTYDWDGTAGSNLTREVNAGGAETLLAECRSLTLTALTQLPSSEELLAGHVGYGPGVAASTQEYLVGSTNHAAQVLTLSRSGAAAFRITKVRLFVRPVTATGSLVVSLRPTLASDPAGSAIESVSRPLAQMSPGANWETFRFSGRDSLALGTLYAVVVRCSDSGGSVGIAFDQITANVPGSSSDYYKYTTNGGFTWQPTSMLPARDLKYMVYGRWLSGTGSLLTISTPFLTGLRIQLETGTAATPVRYEATAECINLPERVE